MVEQELVADPVKLVRADAWRDVAADLRKRSRRDAAGDSHALDRLCVLDVALAEAWCTAADILRAGNAGRNVPLRRNPAGLEGDRHDLQV
jgi:hypothetical protein